MIAASASRIGVASSRPTSAHSTSTTRFTASRRGVFLNPGEKISQLGRRFSTAILPVYSS